jgi:aspartate carbamoyltransferase catalytic subunit
MWFTRRESGPSDCEMRTVSERYAIDSKVVQRMKPDALILHPLPRTVELDKSVDADPRAMYFRQAMNGLYVRMALLTMLLDKEPAAGSAWW